MYTDGTYIAFMTNQPTAHVNEMFGSNDLPEDEFEKTEHVGFVKSVIDEHTYLVMTVRPVEGFRCVIEDNDILRIVDYDELSEEEKSVREMPEFTVSHVYHHVGEVVGESIQDKCIIVTREAMSNLFPDDEIGMIFLALSSDYKKKDLLERLEDVINEDGLNPEKEESYIYFKALLQAKRFKEYYTVSLDIYEDEFKRDMICWIAAVDMNFEEVVIMNTLDERVCFSRSLGPEYDMVYDWNRNLVFKYLTMERKRSNT